jgi:hypothetical protein
LNKFFVFPALASEGVRQLSGVAELDRPSLDATGLRAPAYRGDLLRRATGIGVRLMALPRCRLALGKSCRRPRKSAERPLAGFTKALIHC